ncbi:DNA-dependent metalloprotease WSS1-like isoform X2 [Malania oleifera]|uniref:DNA-dependent metalloprotease WSS1-like isoform X2 n=1 Tax=Malania oleifera TaxID=397392 RepID=UPI0025AE6A7C|nr:DNA-dependent metalloprotease WSS1-like isoform X2 [Malania oleifera]
MILTRSGKSRLSRRLEKMKQGRFLKMLQSRCSQSCGNINGNPSHPSILGLNIGGGAEVKLRLRRPNNEWDFFPFNQILDTMLHELCHNEYAPHNTDFYRLLDEIRQECEVLMAKGITGTGRGFDLPGRRLGGQPPSSSVHQNALAAAENRTRCGALLPSGPKRIGGDSNIMAALSPIQAAAMAAERRLHDDLWCGSKSLESKSDIQGNIESSGPAGRLKASASSDDRSIQTPYFESITRLERADDQALWQCNTCTLLNQPLALTCGACGIQKNMSVGTQLKAWSCKFCTLDNSVELDRCVACGEWRYSYGPPVATPGPYLGT